MKPSAGGAGLMLFGLSFVVLGLARGNGPFWVIGAVFVLLGAATARKNRRNLGTH